MPQRSEWLIGKTEVSSDSGVVASMVRQATEAGISMLERGGNAMDAAVAAGFAAGVAEPFNSGLGGIAVLVYHEARSGKTHVFDGTGTLPAATRSDQFRFADTGAAAGIYGWPEVVDDANNTGYLSPAVPGMPACLLEAQARFGRLSRAEVMAPAVHHAEQGFALDWYIALGMAVNQRRLQRFAQSRRVFFRPDGSCHSAPMLGVEGDIFRQPDLARSLRAIAADGPDAFYRGHIAEQIARDMQENGGLLSYDDLANYRVRTSEGGLSVDYHDYQVTGGLENSGFPTVMQALAILEGFHLGRSAPGSAQQLHLIAEAQRLAFLDRFAHLGDAEGAELPLRGLLSRSFAQERRSQILPDQARLDATAGDPWPHNGGGTAAGRVSGNSGVVLNNGTMWFDPVPGRVNSLAPGRRIMTAGAPIIVTRDGQPVLAVGAPGGRRVISAVIHSMVNMLDHGMGPQQAVNTPRVHCEGRSTVVDVRVGPQTLQALRHLGHQVEEREETFSTSYFGRPNAVMVQPGTGRLLGGVNQYKPTLAIGL